LFTSKGWYKDRVDAGSDEFTQALQVLAGLKDMDFSSQAAYDLWNDTYWSSKSRQYACVGAHRTWNTAGNQLTLPVITKPLAKPTETPAVCLDSSAAVGFDWYSTVWVTVGYMLTKVTVS
jgi:hypothetical protein